jgi:hypothetical protein
MVYTHCKFLFCRIDSCIGQHNHKIFLLTVFLYLVNIVGCCYNALLFDCKWDIGLVPDCSLAYATDRFVHELSSLLNARHLPSVLNWLRNNYNGGMIFVDGNFECKHRCTRQGGRATFPPKKMFLKAMEIRANAWKNQQNSGCFENEDLRKRSRRPKMDLRNYENEDPLRKRRPIFVFVLRKRRP